MGNCPQYTIAHFGIQKMGGIVCPCSPLFKEMELEYELNDAGIEVLVCWDSLIPIVSKVTKRTRIRKIIAANLNDFIPESPSLNIPELAKFKKQLIGGVDDFYEIVTRGDASPPQVEIDMDNDIGLIQYTGGTTGLPKGAMLSFYAALFKTVIVVHVAGLTSDSVGLVNTPIFHIAGMVAGMNSLIYAGATQIQFTVFDPLATVEAIDRYKADYWYSAGPMNLAIMANPASKNYDLTSLKLCLTSSFGIALTEEISRQWNLFTSGGVLVEGAYGLSETHTADTYVPRDKVKYGTMGIPTFETDCRIVALDDRTRELPPGETGELALLTPAAFKGYWNNPEETANTLIDGWVYTGDVCRFDDDGFLHMLGRKKEMIKVSGFSVYPEEVELYLNKYPGVAQSAVIGVADDIKGEVVKAFIVMKPGQTAQAEDIIAWAKANMSAYKAPVYIEFRDSLPTLSTGKLLRRALKDQPRTVPKSE
jgi:long-chain acyl-CoA synthetase